MGSGMTDDRSSLDAAEPRPSDEEPMCPWCGSRISWPYEPGGLVLCHPDRGGCGAYVRPVPYLAAVEGEASGESPGLGTAPARTTWEACCLPYFPARPSGVVARHSQSCPLYASERLTRGELDGWREANRAKAEHPAGTKIEPPLPIMWDEDYVDAHIDDEDDA